MTDYVLLTIPFSHYCERARWAMDISGLKYRESGHLPMIHNIYNRKAGAKRTVPALVTPEGVLTDSGDILNFVAAQGLPLYPAKQELEIRSWERQMDRVLGVQARAWAYCHILGNHDFLREIIQHCDPLEQKLAGPFFGVLEKLLGKHYGVAAGQWQKPLREIQALWLKLDFRLRDGRPYFMGENFTAADITLAALGGILVMPPEYGYAYPELSHFPDTLRKQIEAFRATPTGKFILQLYAGSRHVQEVGV